MSDANPDLAALMANMPVMPPPKGVKSNFDNPQTDGSVLIIVGTIFTILPFLAVVLRLYVRKVISSQQIWWDDALCLLAVLASIAHTTLMIKNLEFGLGKHFWDIRATSMTHKGLVYLAVLDDAVTATGYLTRLSILFLYYRLFKVYESSRRMIWIGMAACTLITIPYLGVIITRAVRCTEPATILVNTFCHTKTTSTAVVAFAALNMTTDFFILLIPIIRFRSLNVNKRKRMGLIGIFAFGFLACAFALIRLAWVCKHFSDQDTLRYALWVGLFSILEVNIALTSNCAIFVPALWKASKTAISIGSLHWRSTSSYSTRTKVYSSKAKSQETDVRKKSRDSDKPMIQFGSQNIELDDTSLRRLETADTDRR